MDMQVTNERRTDRRAMYSRMVIKDAFLTILKSKSYDIMTVSELCREAQISRGTFYLHYDNLQQVLEELLEDALSRIGGVLDLVDSAGGQPSNCTLPLCQFLRDNPKYQAMFFDDALNTVIVDAVARHHLAAFITEMKARSGLEEHALEALFYFQLSGCLAVCKRNAARGDEQWSSIQCAVDSLLVEGIRNL